MPRQIPVWSMQTARENLTRAFSEGLDTYHLDSYFPPMHVDLGHCLIRSFRITDDESLARHANNRKIWINLRDRFPYPYTLFDARTWIATASESVPETHFAIDVDGSAVGGIGFTINDDVFRRSAEIGYWLGEEYWGRGIATAAVLALTEHAFANHDICRIYAGVFEWNRPSARVLEKAGYKLEARLKCCVTKAGKTIDELLYAITLEP
jgi:RimJ/RimL family protein N-acetyltransferase